MLSNSSIAIIGAGPYGLSLAAHLQAKGVEHRIIGDPMEFWRGHMPKGMLLKSDGFASTLYAPAGVFTLGDYCREHGIGYADIGVPVRLEDFCAYGLAFQQRFAPHLNNRKVMSLERSQTGFTLRLNNGESFTAQRVVVATGLSHFEHVPQELAGLPADLVSHSSAHADCSRLKGRDVTVVGGGASATELATLLHEAGASVRMVARRPSIDIHSRMPDRRPLAETLRRPPSPIGPGWKARFFTDLPLVFHRLPKPVQNKLIKGFLGPAGGWFLRGRYDKVAVMAGYRIAAAEASGGRAVLTLRSGNDDTQRIETEHVIAATGFRADVRRVPFLSADIKSQLTLSGDTPELSSHFESSVPGLFFVGAAATGSFGPLLRFACGAKFAARHLSNHLSRAGCYNTKGPAVPNSQMPLFPAGRTEHDAR
jgi:lysine/ornithine N-monooxygenase